MSPTEPLRPAEQRPRVGRGRMVVAGLFALFFAPVLVSLWLNIVKPAWLPTSATNQGALVRPARLLSGEGLQPVTANAVLSEQWTLMFVTDVRRGGQLCSDSCGVRLETMRKTKLALGRETDRLRIVAVAPADIAPATARALGEQYPGLEVLRVPASWLEQLPRPDRDAGEKSDTEAIYLVDPQSYLIMRYGPSVEATGILKDLKRLLRISKIG